MGDTVVTFLSTLQYLAIFFGLIAATLALYGRYRELPSLFTGPHICRLEAGGCQILFRTRQAALLGVPNSVLGLALYIFLTAGLIGSWPLIWLLLAVIPAFLMSVYLAVYLVRNKLECRICWVGHFANLTLFGSLMATWIVTR